MCLRKPRSSGREYPSNTPRPSHTVTSFSSTVWRGRGGQRGRERGWQARRRRTVPSPLMFPSSSTGSSGEDNPRVRQCASSPGQSGPAGRSRCFFPNFCSICSLSRTFKNESAHRGQLFTLCAHTRAQHCIFEASAYEYAYLCLTLCFTCSSFSPSCTEFLHVITLQGVFSVAVWAM